MTPEQAAELAGIKDDAMISRTTAIWHIIVRPVMETYLHQFHRNSSLTLLARTIGAELYEAMTEVKPDCDCELKSFGRHKETCKYYVKQEVGCKPSIPSSESWDSKDKISEGPIMPEINNHAPPDRDVEWYKAELKREQEEWAVAMLEREKVWQKHYRRMLLLWCFGCFLAYALTSLAMRLFK
jgi:hypothetical protein